MAERDDLERRLPVWHALSDLFLDTEQQDEDYRYIARRLSESGYDKVTLRRILDLEVAPAFAFNLFDIAGHWGGWTEAQVVDLVTRAQHEWAAFSLAKRTLVRSHLDAEWARLEPLITIVEDRAREAEMLQKVAFTMYPVKDMAGARAFYEEVLGLGPSRSGATSPWVEFDLPGGGCLAITTVTPNAPSASAGGTIAFEVDDLPATIATLKDKGVAFAAEGIESPVCRMAIIKDPDGNAIILHKLKTNEERAAA